MSIAVLAAVVMGVAVTGCERRAREPRRAQPIPASAPVAPVAPEPGTLALRGLAVEPAALGIARANGLRVAADVGARRVLQEVGGAGASLELSRPHDSTLRFVAPLGARPILVAIDRRANVDALSFGWFTDTGVFAGPPSLPLDARLATLRRASDGETLLVAYAGPSCPVRLVSVTERATTGLEPRALERCDDELGREVIAADLEADGFAVLFRRGVPEDEAGAVVLATDRGSVPIEALHDLGLLESFERIGDRVVVVGSFEFDRPRAFLFDLEGRLLDARRLAPGDACPFGTPRPRVEVEAEPGAVRVTIRDPSGDVRATRRLARAYGTTPPVVTRDGDGFAVAFTTRASDGWAVRVVRLGPDAEVL